MTEIFHDIVSLILDLTIETGVATTWILFLLAATVIAYSGYHLSRFGDLIADSSGLGATWVGTVMIAAVTSLPELATGISAVRGVEAPDLAAGGVFGSCVFNMLILVILDLLLRGKSLFSDIGNSHLKTAKFNIAMIGICGGFVIVHQFTTSFAGKLAGIQFGYDSLLYVVIYLIAMRSLFQQEQGSEPPEGSAGDLRRGLMGFSISAVFVVGAGITLPFLAERIVHLMGWQQAFVGTLFIALATSLPEIAVTFSAFQIGAIDLAVANLFGSNLFNILVIPATDLFYTKAPILSSISLANVFSATSAVVMTVVAILGIVLKPKTKILGLLSWPCIILLLVYVVNSTLVYLF